MKKHYFLGITKTDRACILKSLAPFDALDPADVEKDDFTHVSTDWGGGGSIEHTLKCLQDRMGRTPKLTGREITLRKPISYSGVDYDWGHALNWTFEVVKIAEVE